MDNIAGQEGAIVAPAPEAIPVIVPAAIAASVPAPAPAPSPSPTPSPAPTWDVTVEPVTVTNKTGAHPAFSVTVTDGTKTYSGLVVEH